MGVSGVELFFRTAREREAIRRKRMAGAPQPWTDDAIFRAWRFCNVRREDDKTTEWFRDHVRSKVSGRQAIVATAIFRWFNRIETGERIVDLLLGDWDEAEARRRLTGVKPLITGSFIIRGPNGMDKLNAICYNIREFLARIDVVAPSWGRSLESAWSSLREFPYLGNFMSYEIVSDLRWTDVLSGAEDIETWACAGPGCTRGLGWAAAGDSKHFSSGDAGQAKMLLFMRELLEMSRDERVWPYETRWEMREVEHWACEVWKYVRCLETGQGPRQRFHGGGLL